VADAREHFGQQVFQTVIPRNVRLAEAPSFGKPIVLYDLSSVGAQAYMAVANEVIERTRGGGAGDRRTEPGRAAAAEPVAAGRR
jgi:chromosome partitioning protein